jgi:hypothetical protein
MGQSLGRRALLAVCAVTIVLLYSVGGASAAFHGVAQAKQCVSPVKIGDPYVCTGQILNVVDTAHDTIRVTGLSDTVNAAGGAVPTGNILASTGLVFTGAVTCVGGSGAGTFADPYIGATECLLPFGSNITTKAFSHYTVQPGDFGLPNNKLTDTLTWNWNNTCTLDPDQDCTTNAQTATAGASATVVKLASSTATDIHNAAHGTVTVVEAGTTVHDFVTVSGQPGSPNPTGNVNIDWFLNGDCTGAPQTTSGSIGPLNGSGQFDATGFSFTVNSAGFRAFRAHYLGDATYIGSDGACEPLRVVDANIQITPATATNPVGTNHVLTCHINVNDGTGLANAPAGTVCTASIASGPGSFVGSNQCTTAGTTGSCTVTISSSTPGTTTVQATTNVSVAGLVLTRTTGDAHAGDSSNATKLWADDVVTTAVRDAANADVTNQTVPSGTVVHDEATVAKAPNTPAAAPAPTGTVTFTLYSTATCNGAVVATDANKPLNASGVATSVTFTTPNAGGVFSYRAHYNGDANYPAHDAACEPFQVNAVEGQGRVTGGGSIFDTVNGVPNTRITHGFELRCDPNDRRQSLEINWAGGNNFHLEKLINSVVCFDDPTTSPPPPPGTVIDTYAGNTLFEGHTGYHGFGYAVGTGICNKLPATIYFILIDAGEPGTADIAEYHITGGCTLNVGPKLLTFGNHQFHKH